MRILKGTVLVLLAIGAGAGVAGLVGPLDVPWFVPLLIALGAGLIGWYVARQEGESLSVLRQPYTPKDGRVLALIQQLERLGYGRVEMEFENLEATTMYYANSSHYPATLLTCALSPLQAVEELGALMYGYAVDDSGYTLKRVENKDWQFTYVLTKHGSNTVLTTIRSHSKLEAMLEAFEIVNHWQIEGKNVRN